MCPACIRWWWGWFNSWRTFYPWAFFNSFWFPPCKYWSSINHRLTLSMHHSLFTTITSPLLSTTIQWACNMTGNMVHGMNIQTDKSVPWSTLKTSWCLCLKSSPAVLVILKWLWTAWSLTVWVLVQVQKRRSEFHHSSLYVESYFVVH